MESNDNECDKSEGAQDIESEDDKLSFVRIVPNRDRSPPIPVPFNPNYVVLRGHHNQSSVDFSVFGLSDEVRSSSESEWRLSTDSGTQFDDDDDNEDNDECGRRRISTGAESGYYGSPFNNNSSRIGWTPMTDVGSTTMFAFDDLDMSVSRRSSTGTRPVVAAPRLYPLLFPSNMTEEQQQPSTSANNGRATAALPEPAMTLTFPQKADANAVQDQCPPRPCYYERCENTFRSIGTQTSDVDVDVNEEHDPMRDEGLYETYDTDDAFLPNVESAVNGSGEEGGPTTLPDLIPISCDQRHRAHSVSLPLTPAVRAGRFLALIATQFDDERRPNANRQNGPSPHSASYPGDNNNGGFLNFLRSSLKSRRRPRAQSASAALP